MNFFQNMFKDIQAQVENDLINGTSTPPEDQLVTTTSSGTVANLNSLFNNTFTMAHTMSNEEIEELSKLEEERKSEIKLKKIEIFRKLPANLRQKIVDEIMLERTQLEMENVEVPYSSRHQELINKKGLEFNMNSLRIDSIGGYPLKITRTFRVDDISDDELIAAHNDATMEESIRGT
jgi:hypothetical protein